MPTIDDKIFILQALKGGAKFFLNRENIDTMLAMRERLGIDTIDRIIVMLREV